MPMITVWLMVVITAIYVIATIFICSVNIKSAKATRDQLLESKHQFYESKRFENMPYFEISISDEIKEFVDNPLRLVISKYIENEHILFDIKIKIKNIGLGVAKDIHYEWINLDGSFLRNNLDFMACIPGETKEIYIDFLADIRGNVSGYKADVQFSLLYKDLLENSYRHDIGFEFYIGDDTAKLINHKVEKR